MAVVSINEVTVCFVDCCTIWASSSSSSSSLLVHILFLQGFQRPSQVAVATWKKKRMSGLTQVSKLQKICGGGAETTIVFSKPQLQQATALSSNETIKTDFLDRRGSPVY